MDGKSRIRKMVISCCLTTTILAQNVHHVPQVKVMPGSTFRLNLSCTHLITLISTAMKWTCTSANAWSAGRSHGTHVGHKNIITPQSHKPVMGSYKIHWSLPTSWHPKTPLWTLVNIVNIHLTMVFPYRRLCILNRCGLEHSVFRTCSENDFITIIRVCWSWWSVVKGSDVQKGVGTLGRFDCPYTV